NSEDPRSGWGAARRDFARTHLTSASNVRRMQPAGRAQGAPPPTSDQLQIELESFPEELRPMQAASAEAPFSSSEYLFEVKWVGRCCGSLWLVAARGWRRRWRPAGTSSCPTT